MEENKVVETEVEKTEEEAVDVVDEKKEKRKKLIKRILIGLAGAGAVIGAGALLLKKEPEVEEYSPDDLEKKGLYNEDGITDTLSVKADPAGEKTENLWKITEIEKIDSQTETTEG